MFFVVKIINVVFFFLAFLSNFLNIALCKDELFEEDVERNTKFGKYILAECSIEIIEVIVIAQKICIGCVFTSTKTGILPYRW